MEKNDKSWNAKLNSKRFGGQFNSFFLKIENKYRIPEFNRGFIIDFLTLGKDKIANYKSIKYCNNSNCYLIPLRISYFPYMTSLNLQNQPIR